MCSCRPLYSVWNNSVVFKLVEKWKSVSDACSNGTGSPSSPGIQCCLWACVFKSQIACQRSPDKNESGDNSYVNVSGIMAVVSCLCLPVLSLINCFSARQWELNVCTYRTSKTVPWEFRYWTTSYLRNFSRAAQVCLRQSIQHWNRFWATTVQYFPAFYTSSDHKTFLVTRPIKLYYFFYLHTYSSITRIFDRLLWFLGLPQIALGPIGTGLPTSN